MAQGIVHVVAQFTVKSEQADEFAEKAHRLLVVPTQQEKGCIRYELCRNLEDPAVFAMIEAWESEDDLKTHLGQPSLQKALPELMPMVAKPPVIQRFRPVTS